MKNTKILILSISLVSVSISSGANYVVSNLVAASGPTDTLFQEAGPTTNAPLLNGGIVSLGYFGSNSYVPSSATSMVAQTVEDFTLVTSALTGSFSDQLQEAGTAGYVDAPLFDGSVITAPNALIGRAVYAFVGNASTLELSSAFALYQVGTIVDETAFESEFNVNPAGTVPGTR